ncbi:uncharacterized protein E0L32_000205 [Thyridium curvatum]|uniref:Uncharacterized protein n=1 Tax=Thyridium curvatum TaxID=1093900 RepID=A0A507BFW6_9PEZI|nr:uncharacterized protein E0L32_000205 [Thyridium curvatum]TPX15871.1 hypothetical protein E0L32_000205 [Thyridium curvatum]
MSTSLSTADVPPEFLEAAFLVGHIPLRSLPSEPRVSYALYVPKEQYNAKASAEAKLPLLVHIHGTGRRLSGLDFDYPRFADRLGCAVLFPLFPCDLDGPDDLGSYKILRSHSLRADLALLSMLDEVGRVWPGIDTEKVFLEGFSGGGHFTHRFLYLYPERLAAASVGAPGKATSLDETQNWPIGIADVEDRFGRTVKKEVIAQVPIQMVVGSEDVHGHGGAEFWAWVRTQRLKAQGISEEDAAKTHIRTVEVVGDRVKTLRDLQAEWLAQGITVQFDVVDGVAHDEQGVRGTVLEFIESEMRKQRNA